MGDAIVCDHCGTVLEVNGRGDDENGEASAWLSVGTRDRQVTADACSRACAVELLGDETWLTAQITARFAGLAEVARILREHRDDGDEE